MEMDTPGGVIRGYWAIGRLASAMPPISVMTTDSTVAKIGRSMKKREITSRTPAREIRNPKHQIRNKFEIRILKSETVLVLRISGFVIVSDLGLRISDLPPRPAGPATAWQCARPGPPSAAGPGAARRPPPSRPPSART